jgi:hypothetical protein
MKSEFNEPINEYNSDVTEHKIIGDIECFSLRRELVSTNENSSLAVAENYNESDEGKGTRNSDVSSKDVAQEQQNRLDNVNKNKRQIEDHNTDTNPLLNSGEAAADSAAATSTTAAASGASSTATVVSSATLSGMTILAAGTVLAISVGNTIFNKVPTVDILSEDYGTEYVQYELDIKDLTPGSSYVLRLSLGQEKVYEEPVLENGIYKKLITGLIPARTYVLQLIEKDDLFGHERFNHTFWTDDSDVPKANFDFDSRVDFDKGEFILDYNIYISDHYKTGRDTYLEIYSGENYDKLIVKDDNVENNYIKGALTDLPDGIDLLANVYTTYTDKKTGVEENRLIGSYKYLYKYPETDAVFSSNFDLSSNSFKSTLDKENAINKVDIDTGFDAKDSSESYKLELYCGDELIDSIITNERKVSFDVPVYYRNLTTKIIPLKETEAGKTRFKEIEANYEVTPDLFLSQGCDFYDEGYYVNITMNPEVFGVNDEITATIDIYDKSGNKTSKEMPFENADYQSLYFGTDEQADNNVSRIYIEVKCNDKLYAKLDYNNLKASMEIVDYEIDDDGNILFKYKISDIDGYNFYLANIEGNGEIERVESSDSGHGIHTNDPVNESGEETTLKEGTIKITCLYSGEVEFNSTLRYKNAYGAIVAMPVSTTPIDLSASVETDCYVSYLLSELACNIKFDVLVDNKPVNMSLSLENQESSGYETKYVDTREGRYYSLKAVSDDDSSTGEYTYYLNYRIVSEGFNNDFVKLDIPSSFADWYANPSSELFNYSSDIEYYKDEIHYIKTKNADGTVNYYFYTNFTDNDNLHSQRIEYYYNEDYKDNYFYTELFDDKYYALENLEDKDYKFNYQYLYDAPDGYTYLSTKFRGVEYSNSDIVSYTNTNIKIDGDQTEIQFVFDQNLIDTSNIKIKVLDNEYSIAYKSATDDGVTETSDGIEYEVTKEGYKYSVMRTDSNMNVTLTIYSYIDPQDFKDSPPLLITKNRPNMIDKIGVNNFKALDSYVKDVELDIINYQATFTVGENFNVSNNVSYYTASDNRYEISIYDYEFVSNSYKEEVEAIIYDENDEIIATNSNRGAAIDVYIPDTYTKVKIRIRVVKHVGDVDIYYEDYDLGTLTIE